MVMMQLIMRIMIPIVMIMTTIRITMVTMVVLIS